MWSCCPGRSSVMDALVHTQPSLHSDSDQLVTAPTNKTLARSWQRFSSVFWVDVWYLRLILVILNFKKNLDSWLIWTPFWIQANIFISYPRTLDLVWLNLLKFYFLSLLPRMFCWFSWCGLKRKLQNAFLQDFVKVWHFCKKSRQHFSDIFIMFQRTIQGSFYFVFLKVDLECWYLWI